MWLRGDSGDRGLQKLGMSTWVQQNLEPLMLNNENDQYQSMASAALHDIRNSDALKQQFLQLQHPFQYSQQPFRNNPLTLQQIIPQMHSQQIQNSEMHGISESSSHQDQLQQAYHESFQIPNDQIQQNQIALSSPLSQKTIFPDTGANFPQSLPAMQNVMGNLCHEGNANLLNFSRTEPVVSEGQHQSWDPKFSASNITTFSNTVPLPFLGKDTSLETEHCNVDSQNHTLFGVHIDSPPFLPTAAPNLGTATIDNDVATIPYGNTCFQNSLYGCVDETSSLLHNTEETDQQNRSFVKVIFSHFSSNITY